MLKKLGALFDCVLAGAAVLACLIFAFSWFSVIFEIGMRGFLNRPQIWVLDYTSYGLLYFTLLGAAWLLKREQHVKIDVILNLFNGKTQTWLNIVTSILCVISSLVITWYGVVATLARIRSGVYFFTELRTPEWAVFCIIPVGSFLLFIQFLRRMHAQWEGLKAMSAKQLGGKNHWSGG